MSGFDNSAVCTTSNNDAKLHRFETRLITAPNPKSIGFISYDTNKDQQKQNKKLTNYFFIQNTINIVIIIITIIKRYQYEFRF